MTPDPRITAIPVDRVDDPYVLEEAEEAGRETWDRIPNRYRDATVDVPEIATWVTDLVVRAHSDNRRRPAILAGPSLLLVGSTGTGKTHQAYGAVRALTISGARCPWQVVTAADLYARLRPRARVDTEDEFDKVARVGLLVLDDLGAAKGSEWNEEINYRLINYRYEHEKPTLVTSNVPPKHLADALGERAASRLVQMSTQVVLGGQDRRLGAA